MVTHLSDLLRAVEGATPLDGGDPEISSVTCDSREVCTGALFVAVQGAHTDGHDHLTDAAGRGAVACVVERPVAVPGCVRVQVPDAEAALGRAACAFWGDPAEALDLVGITGTNGKTTVAYLIQHLLASAGRTTGRLGTVAYAFPDGDEPAALTTPDAPALQAALRRMVDQGAEAAVMEVSSHALHRRRVEGCTFACTVFTNLTQDHLDYHGTMDAYYEAKRLLFTQCAPEAPAVINADDPFGARLAGEIPGRAVTYGLERGRVRLELTHQSLDGTRADLVTDGRRIPVTVPLVGSFNALNTACALAAAVALDLDLERACAALARVPGIPGRLEPVANDRGLTVFVDYAHTHDALDRVLEAVGGLCGGRLLGVFGCGGDRDRGKRPLMAKAAARWCDALVLTADNSRSEPTEAILDEIEIGLPVGWHQALGPDDLDERHRFARVADRAEAIRWALAAACPGDAVVIAGKGHETTQTLGDRVLAFDDRRVAARWLSSPEGHA